MTEREKIIEDVLKDRKWQVEKRGEQNHNAYVWATIIGTEYGEMCKALNDNSTPKSEQYIYWRVIHIMAICMAMLECIEKNRRKGK